METKKFPPYTVCHSHYVSHRQHWMATLLGGIVAPTWRIRRSNWIQWFFFNLFAGKERILKILIPQQRNIKHVLRWTWIHTLIHHPQFSLLVSSTTNFKSVENLLKRMIDFCCYTLPSACSVRLIIPQQSTAHYGRRLCLTSIVRFNTTPRFFLYSNLTPCRIIFKQICRQPTIIEVEKDKRRRISLVSTHFSTFNENTKLFYMKIHSFKSSISDNALQSSPSPSPDARVIKWNAILKGN